MNLGPYQLQAQLGAGDDGISYRGRDSRDGRMVEVHVLSGARAEEERWKGLTKRLRLAAMLEHESALAVRELNLDHDPPYLILDWEDAKTLASAIEGDVPLPAMAVAQIGKDLAAVLAAAHRFGLVHGDLRPGAIQLSDAGTAIVNLTGARTRAATGPVPTLEIDVSCRAPERLEQGRSDPAEDVYSLGAVLYWLVQGRPAATVRDANTPCSPAEPPLASDGVAAQLGHFISRMLAADPTERPSARMVLDRLSLILSPSEFESEAARLTAEKPAHSSRFGTTRWVGLSQQRTVGAARDSSPDLRGEAEVQTFVGTRLGRYRLLEKLGEGGLGAVYRAEDMTDGTIVAVKILLARWDEHPQALRRLKKEARLLAEVNNPYVANLIEMNEDHGLPYLVLEFVSGKSLRHFLGEHQRLDEPTAIAIMADVARALVDAHSRGIVHRDIKPENILLEMGEKLHDKENDNGAFNGDGFVAISSPGVRRPMPFSRVKLCDFGLARHILQSDSLNVTRVGTAVGTPFYASPEQCSGRTVGARTDVYSMGATLFHLLAGRPPFLGDSVLALSAMHANEPPPPLRRLNPEVSEAASRIVEKALAKNPDSRYANAGEMLVDLERVLRGEPTSIVIHPRLPACAPSKLFQYDWCWDLEASPEQLWPLVSNTERFNRAAGLPPVLFTTQADTTGAVRRIGEFRKAGFTNVWQEHPFEWVEGRRMGVLREYSQGVFKWLATMTELAPRAGGGTTLTHQVRIEPRGFIGKFVAAVEVGIRGRRTVEKVYRRMDAFLTRESGSALSADPFEKPPTLASDRRARLDRLLDKLLAARIDPVVIEQLGEFVRCASDQEVARIRPLALASRFALDPDEVVTACLLGAREGLFVLLWDIVCPICRIPATIKDTLRELSEHEHCEACNLDFELDFTNSVEMIFRVHPEIRRSELGTYCIGGPVHSPHVAAQVRIAPAEHIELELALGEGTHRLRGPQLPWAIDFQVRPAAALTRWDVNLAPGARSESIPPLRAGRQLLALSNSHEQELLIRVERTASRADALTAARASTLAAFREWFPGEVLSPGQLVSISTVTLLVADLEHAGDLYQQLGDARAFAVVQEYFQVLNDSIRQEGGALVKTIGEGVVAAFPEPVAAVRVGLELPQKTAERLASRFEARDLVLRPRVGIHRGPVLAATLNGNLDYFGTTVSLAARLPSLLKGGEMVLTQSVAGDPRVAALLHSIGRELEVMTADSLDRPDLILHRLVPSKNSSD